MWNLYLPTARSVLSTVRIQSSMVTASVAMGVIRPLSTCMKEMNGYTAVIRPLQVWQCECGNVSDQTTASVAMWVIRPLSIYNACLSRSRMGTETLLYVALLLLLIFSNSFIYLLLKYSHGWLRHECLGCARQNSIWFFFHFSYFVFSVSYLWSPSLSFNTQ